MHHFLHLEIDAAAWERIHMVEWRQANGNNRVVIQFRTCKTGIKAVRHQADFFEFQLTPNF